MGNDKRVLRELKEALEAKGMTKRRRVRFFLSWYYFWVGLYFDRKKKTLYFCPFFCCVFAFDFSPGVKAFEFNEGQSKESP